MLVCITVSTNYSDILRVIMSQDIKFIDEWFIITSKNDKSTINLIQNNKKITVLFYDFENNNNKFDKGGAIRSVQEKIYNLYSECLILLMDSDIYLPDNFINVIKSTKFNVNKLYHPSKRLDFYKLSEFYEKKNYMDYPWMEGQGFFQLYYYNTKIVNNKKYLYKKSYNCSECDLLFRKQFKEMVHLDIIVYHLGRNGRNWDGRKDIDFVIDTKIKD